MEREFIDWLRQRVGPHPRLKLGIGDDAAILAATGGDLAAATDLITDGVDFVLGQCDPRRVGRKALAVNLSDLAAMAARPIAALVSLALPRAGADLLARELYEGLLPLAEKYDVAVAGGDTNTWDGPLVVSVTVLGELAGHDAWRRGGGRPGDRLLVTGQFGGSILGRHFDFEPRVEEALLLAGRYHVRAAIDVSDGLSLDLSRLAAESGCGAEVRLASIPVSAAARELAARADKTALQHALSDGEDFELILAVEPREAERLLADQPLGVRITEIGELIETAGLWSSDETGARHPLAAHGYEH
jgi:thiamine-monophosphate kinase